MQESLQITFRDIPHSAAVKERIQEKIAKLDHLFDRVTACKVVIGYIQKHQHTGKLHNVSIYLAVPGKDLSVSHHSNENLYLAIQTAVDSLRQQLMEYREERLFSYYSKDHGVRRAGTIVRLLENDEYGFIADAEQNEYYFNLGHLIGTKFHQLKVGEKVRFLPALGNDGLQARRVTVNKRSRELH